MTLEEQFDAFHRIDVLCNVAKRALRRAMADDETLQRMMISRAELTKDIRGCIDVILHDVERLKDGAR